jgi:hypothetical protein
MELVSDKRLVPYHHEYDKRKGRETKTIALKNTKY